MDELARIREFVVDNFMMGDASSELGDDDSLLERGVIDSTGVLELVAFVEETFDLEVQDSEVVPENFDTPNCLAAYIRKKKGQGGGPERGDRSFDGTS